MSSKGTRFRIARVGGAVAAVLVVAAFLATRVSSTSALDPRPSALAGVPSTLDRPLPQIDGTIQVPGLDSAVVVRRDRWGVPHIYARTAHDLFFAQGFVAAQDRLFQMEMWRRQGEGRLAEVVGPSAIERDRFARAFRYRGDMAKEWAAYAPDAKALVAAFVQGVNAQIAEAKRTKTLPLEFGLMGFEPEPWAPEVPLNRVTGLSGAGNASSEVMRARLVSLVGAERANALLPPDPPRALDPVAGLDLSGIDARTLGGGGFGGTFSDIAYSRVEGSNNWVVSGRLTASGKPILANDPHRIITHPSVRYITHLVAPGWNVIGAGEPASPGISIGHNDRIAFGLTIVGMDQQDVYVERLKTCPDGGRCVWANDRWEPVRTVTDTIRIKGQPPRVVRLEFTSHGPIISQDSIANAAGERPAFVVRSVHAEPGSAAYLASLSLDRARNWRDFSAAMARWAMPSENMIYADVDGNIGWIASGKMPKRRWSGMLPVPGDGRYEWDGFLSVDQLPQAYNPATGFIATANHNILPPGYTTPIAYEWASRYRIDRIREVLSGGSRFTIADFERLQHDDLSLLAKALVPTLIDAARTRGASDRPEVRDLAGWDYRMTREGRAPLIFEAWSTALSRLVSRAMEPADLPPNLGLRADLERVEAAMTGKSLGTATLGRRVADSLALVALDEAVADLGRRYGADRSKWTWGAVHVAEFRHPLSRAHDLPAVSRGGDANTVYATGGREYRQSSGASYRQIIDLADFDNSVATNVPGQSARPGSEYYGNLLELWGNDRYFPLVFSRARVEKETKHVLTLLPGK